MILIFLCGVFASTVQALPPITGQRLFRLDAPNGRVSFVLAAAHGVVTSEQKLMPVSMVLRRPCQVYLQGDLFRESDIEGAETAGDLTRVLDDDQIATYQRIVGRGPKLLQLNPGVANTLVRNGLGDAFVAAAEPFELKLRHADVRKQSRLLDGNSYDPHLRDGLELLFGEALAPSILISTVLRVLAEDERDSVVLRSHATYVRTEAGALDRPITELHPPPGQSLLQAQLRLLDAEALRRTLDQIGRRLVDGGALFVDARAAFLIAREANARFFTLSPEQYGHARDVLAKSILDHHVWLDGDEALAVHHANLHSAWFDQLWAAIERGGAFIVLDAERVIPGVNSKVERTLLEEVERRGAQITPLAAERAGPRAVK